MVSISIGIAHPLYAQSSSAPMVVDRVVAVVNHQSILQSDLDREVRVSVLEPRSVRRDATPQSTLQRLISRTLIEQQIRQEDAVATEPSQKELQDNLAELRRALPACVRMNCTTEAGWKSFLAANQLTELDVEQYLRRRHEILGFIENRFRAGIRIPSEDIEQYYRKALIPEYPKGQATPSLESIAPRIQEILLQQQVNTLFSAWLDNLRKQGDVEILDPSLETSPAPAQGDDSK